MSPKTQGSNNPEQQKAAEAPKTPLLIVAGAGTGKTRTLISRIVHLIESGTMPERICAITFTNKAAAEMQSRIAAALGGDSVSAGGGRRAALRRTPYMGTFHSLGARILRQECRVFGREPNFAIFDDHDSFDLIKKVAKSAFPKKGGADSDIGGSGSASAKEKKQRKEAPVKFARKISELKNLDAEVVFAKMDARERQTTEAIFHAYELALQRNNAFDFDDLIEKPVAMFKAHPEILHKHQNRFDAILVDEYQDINPKQYEFVALLAGTHRNLTVVGDDEQTIYTWRYADIKIFLDFDKNWPGAAVHFLEENYRSTGNIINGASAVVQNNRFRTPKKLWTKAEAGEPIMLYEAWGENDEAAWIGLKISEMRAVVGVATAKNSAASGGTTSGTASEKTTDDVRPNYNAPPSIAILYRTNAQSRAIEQALIRESIPYKIFGGLKFYERREVKDAVAALRYVANTKDELSRERLEKNLSKRKFAEFRAAVANLVDAGNVLTDGRVGLVDGATGTGTRTAAGVAGPKPTDVIKIFLATFGYLDYLADNFTNADERQENIAELINFASGFENLPELLERLSLLQATDDENAAAKSEMGGAGALFAKAPDAKTPDVHATHGAQVPMAAPVHLSTIHMAKGLEFDAVFVAGAAEGLLPHIRSIDNDASLEEERRLMYVAMTRARKNLYISFYGLPSRFIAEIPEEYTTLSGDAAGAGDEAGDGAPKKRAVDPYARDDDYYAEENVVDF